jgi:hypothetical protein
VFRLSTSSKSHFQAGEEGASFPSIVVNRSTGSRQLGAAISGPIFELTSGRSDRTLRSLCVVGRGLDQKKELPKSGPSRCCRGKKELPKLGPARCCRGHSMAVVSFTADRARRNDYS